MIATDAMGDESRIDLLPVMVDKDDWLITVMIFQSNPSIKVDLMQCGEVREA